MLNQIDKENVRRLHERIFNKRDLKAVDELVAPNFVDHDALQGFDPGPDGLRQMVRWLTSAFPDYQMTVDDVIADGDKVVLLISGSGTQQGEFMGIPATHKHFDNYRQVHILRFQNGRATEHWAVRDEAGLMRQLGVMPAPAVQ